MGQEGDKPTAVLRAWWASMAYGFWAAVIVGSGLGALGVANLPLPVALGGTTVAALTAGALVAVRLRVEVYADRFVVVNPLRTYRLPRRQLRVEKDCLSSLAGGGRPAPMLVLSRPDRVLPIRALATIRVRDADLEDLAKQLRSRAGGSRS